MPQHITPANIATAFVAINFIAFAAFGLDKATVGITVAGLHRVMATF